MTVLTFFITMLEKINTNEKLRIVIAKEYQHKSTVKGFHVYKEIWNPVDGGVLDTRMEPENPTDKFAVCIEENGNVVESFAYAKTRSLLQNDCLFSEKWLVWLMQSKNKQKQSN